MKIAIVILNWNGEKLLEKFIPSIVKYSNLSNVEIAIADNNSTDDSVAFIEKNFPQITIVKNAKNGGYAKGYNDALKHVSADIYALVNSDIEVTGGWLNTTKVILGLTPCKMVLCIWSIKFFFTFLP